MSFPFHVEWDASFSPSYKAFCKCHVHTAPTPFSTTLSLAYNVPSMLACLLILEHAKCIPIQSPLCPLPLWNALPVDLGVVGTPLSFRSQLRAQPPQRGQSWSSNRKQLQVILCRITGFIFCTTHRHLLLLASLFVWCVFPSVGYKLRKCRGLKFPAHSAFPAFGMGPGSY